MMTPGLSRARPHGVFLLLTQQGSPLRLVINGQDQQNSLWGSFLKFYNKHVRFGFESVVWSFLCGISKFSLCFNVISPACSHSSKNIHVHLRFLNLSVNCCLFTKGSGNRCHEISHIIFPSPRYITDILWGSTQAQSLSFCEPPWAGEAGQVGAKWGFLGWSHLCAPQGHLALRVWLPGVPREAWILLTCHPPSTPPAQISSHWQLPQGHSFQTRRYYSPTRYTLSWMNNVRKWK